MEEKQRVLITGGATGIGLAVARSFANDGARVHIADSDPMALQEICASSPNISGTVVDISDGSAVDDLLEDVQSVLEGLDVLVNNAGIAGPTSPVENYELEDWAAVIGVNLNGTFNVTKRVIPLLKASTRGTIIVMSSLAGRFGYPNRCAYATTKWGLIGFAKTLSMELGPAGITCNSILPGAVEGPRIKGILQGRAGISGRTIDREIEAALENQSIKSFVDPDDIAALIMFLSGKHGRTISGQSFAIDGDSKSTQ